MPFFNDLKMLLFVINFIYYIGVCFMNEIREIVTKAVVAKGKKVINLNQKIITDIIPYSILGCWIINHEFDAKRKDDDVILNGSFEVNIWYSSRGNSKTDVLRSKINYSKPIKVVELVKEYLDENNEDVVAKMLKHPTVTNAKILDDSLEIDITFDCLVEVIGETKMSVTVFKDEINDDILIEDLDIDVNEDFINDIKE